MCGDDLKCAVMKGCLCCNNCLASVRNKKLQLIYKYLSYPPYMACKGKSIKGHSEIWRHKIEFLWKGAKMII